MKPDKDQREESGAHPGWSVQFSDGSWLGGAHGWFRTNEAWYADIYDSEEDAKSSLNYARSGNENYFDLDAKIVLAWEPLCEMLRWEIKRTRAAAVVTSDDVYYVVESLEDIMRTLKNDVIGTLKPNKKT